jgi:hypothetical protein
MLLIMPLHRNFPKSLKIQPPIAPIVHPKMNSGKETVANADF